MKRTKDLKWMILSLLLVVGNLGSWAQGPTVGTFVGSTVAFGDQVGLVTYQVNGPAATVGGQTYYPVTITGLDADGLKALEEAQDDPSQKIALRIPVSFNEKFGTNKFDYAVTKIADGLVGTTKQAFYGYTEIESLVFVDGTVSPNNFSYTVGTPTGLGKTFYGCTNLKELTFTSNCTYIGKYAFQNTAIKEFVIPKQCADIDEYAFYNCKKLNTVSVASGNTVMHKLKTHVFGNSSLQTLDLSNASSLFEFKGEPFMYNLSVVNDVLKKVILPASVKDIDYAFKNCYALTEIEGFAETSLGEPAGTPGGSPVGQHIKDGAFEGCRSLTRLDIPSCDVIGSPFVGCVALDTLTFKASYNKTIGKTLAANHNLFGDYSPANVVANDQKALKVIEFKGVLNGTIEDNAFVGMTALQKVDFKGKLQSNTHIKGAFKDVTSLTDVVFNGINSDGVANVTIESNAFKNTGIAAINFNGINLQSVNNKNFEIYADAFSECANLAKITTGAITVKNTGTIDIQANAFVKNPKLTQVNIGNASFTGAGTIQIGAAFKNNEMLNKVVFGTTTFNADGTYTIANDAFATGNIALANVEFGAITSTKASPATGYLSTMTIGTGARVFGDGAHLATVKFNTIDANTFSIGASAFASTGLTTVEFDNITTPHNTNATFTINASAFEGGNFDDKIVTFKNVSETGNGQMTFDIKANAFKAAKLKEVTFGNFTAKDVDIRNAAFQSDNLQKVKIGDIKASDEVNSTFDIDVDAFQGGTAAAKNVEIGTISDNGSKELTAVIAATAFAATKLNEVKIGNMDAQSITIAAQAFQGDGLTKVELGNITASPNTAPSTLAIGDNAFQGGKVAAKEVKIGAIKDFIHPTNSANDKTLTVTIGDNAFAADSLKKVEIGEIAASSVTIGGATTGASFAGNLQTVTLGNIGASRAANSTVNIKLDAFRGGKVAAKTVTIGTIKDYYYGSPAIAHSLDLTIGNDAFAADSLKSVTILDMAAQTVNVGLRAFQGKNLQNVTLNNIAASRGFASNVTFGANAFQGGEVAAKTVQIGKIVNSPTRNLTAAINASAFAGDSLKSVTIKDMTANSLTIGASAFSGKALTSVSLGKMTAATLAINGANAFANVNMEKAMEENISLGEIGAGLNITAANTFKGPQADGSVLNVTITKIGGAATIPANTFVAAPKGTTTYTVTDDVVAGSLANVTAGAFTGSQENVTLPVNNTTDVWFKGNYNDDFAAADVFTNVNDLKIAVANTDGDAASAKEYNVVGDLRAFKGAKLVTIGNIATGKSIVANTVGSTNEIKEIVFLKNVADANAIGVFNSPDIRKIEFKNVEDAGVKVHAGAVANNAFVAAADAALAVGENLSVIYRENQTREAEVIFGKQAFSTINDAARPVTLYTTSWAKANTFEAADVEANDLLLGDRAVYRLGFTESEVAPGEDIKATIAKKDGNKYGFGKLFIPKGVNMLYKVPAQYDADADKNAIQLYYGRIDNSNNKIYMYSLPVIDDYYWIDATDVDQAFVVRTNTELQPATEIVAQPVTEEDLAVFAAGDPSDYYFFDAALAIQNQLRYNPAEIANQELKNNAEFVDRPVYVMANPTNHTNLTFAKFDKNATWTTTANGHEAGELRSLSAKSLYIVGKVGAAAARPIVIFDDEDTTTGIENATVNVEESNGAVYNLQGVRVNKTQKGIYIQNGKKFIVK